jgi:intergrase/recombinase
VKALSEGLFSVLNSANPYNKKVLTSATNLMEGVNQIIFSKDGDYTFKEELKGLFLDKLSSDNKTLLEKLEELYEKPLPKHSNIGMSINFFQEQDEAIGKAKNLLKKLVNLIDQPIDKRIKLGQSVVLNDEDIHKSLTRILSFNPDNNSEVKIGENFDVFVNELLARKFTNRVTYIEGKAKFLNNPSNHEKYYRRSFNEKIEKLSSEFNEIKDNIISPETVDKFKEVYKRFQENFYSLTVTV